MLRRFTQAVFCLIHACLLISVATCFVRPVRLDGSLPSRSSRIIISRTHSGTRSDTQLHAAAIHANKVQVAMKSQNAFRGKLLIIASKLFVSPKTYWEIVQRIWGQTYWPEVAMLVAFVNALPLSRQLFAWRYARRHNIIDTNDDDDDHAMVKAFAKSKSRKIALVVRQVGLLQAFMYGSDILWVALRYLDFAFVNKFQAQKVAGSILTVCWATYNIRRLKDHYLFQQRSKGPVVTSATPAEEFVVVDSNGDYQSVATTRHTVSNVADIFIYSCAFLTIVDLLGVELGFALKSIFGLGSFGMWYSCSISRSQLRRFALILTLTFA